MKRIEGFSWAYWNPREGVPLFVFGGGIGFLGAFGGRRVLGRLIFQVRAWMRDVVNFAQFLGRHVRVDLRRHDILVPLEFLNRANIGSRVEKMRRETVTQRVRRNAFVQSRFFQISVEFARDASRRQGVSVLVEKEGFF